MSENVYDLSDQCTFRRGRYRRTKDIGHGAYSHVMLVYDNVSGDQRVIKRVYDTDASACNEVEILRKVRESQYIVKFHDSFTEKEGDTDVLHIVMEYCERGDMEKFLKDRKRPDWIANGVLGEWFMQLLQGVAHLHSLDILHRDLKTANVFITAHDTLKIADFGISRCLTRSQCATTMVGTPFYMAPEVVNLDMKDGYNAKSDVWSLGVIMYELCALQLPFPGANVLAVANGIMVNKPEELPEHILPRLRDVVFQMMQSDANKRPDIKTVLLEWQGLQATAKPQRAAHEGNRGGAHVPPALVIRNKIRRIGEAKKVHAHGANGNGVPKTPEKERKVARMHIGRHQSPNSPVRRTSQTAGARSKSAEESSAHRSGGGGRIKISKASKPTAVSAVGGGFRAPTPAAPAFDNKENHPTYGAPAPNRPHANHSAPHPHDATNINVARNRSVSEMPARNVSDWSGAAQKDPKDTDERLDRLNMLLKKEREDEARRLGALAATKDKSRTSSTFESNRADLSGSLTSPSALSQEGSHKSNGGPTRGVGKASASPGRGIIHSTSSPTTSAPTASTPTYTPAGKDDDAKPFVRQQDAVPDAPRERPHEDVRPDPPPNTAADARLKYRKGADRKAWGDGGHGDTEQRSMLVRGVGLSPRPASRAVLRSASGLGGADKRDEKGTSPNPTSRKAGLNSSGGRRNGSSGVQQRPVGRDVERRNDLSSSLDDRRGSGLHHNRDSGHAAAPPTRKRRATDAREREEKEKAERQPVLKKNADKHHSSPSALPSAEARRKLAEHKKGINNARAKVDRRLVAESWLQRQDCNDEKFTDGVVVLPRQFRKDTPESPPQHVSGDHSLPHAGREASYARGDRERVVDMRERDHHDWQKTPEPRALVPKQHHRDPHQAHFASPLLDDRDMEPTGRDPHHRNGDDDTHGAYHPQNASSPYAASPPEDVRRLKEENQKLRKLLQMSGRDMTALIQHEMNGMHMDD